MEQCHRFPHSWQDTEPLLHRLLEDEIFGTPHALNTRNNTLVSQQ